MWYQIRLELDNGGILLVTVPAFPDATLTCVDNSGKYLNLRTRLDGNIRLSPNSSLPTRI